MGGIYIVLIIIGAVLIVASCIVSDKTSLYKENVQDVEIWSDKDETVIRERINAILSEKSEQLVDETEDKLCHLSNKKIMEFQDFSNQLFAKLDENHNQSVFLYKMLNEKQTEMKEWIAELDSRYADIKNEFGKAEEQLNGILSQIPEDTIEESADKNKKKGSNQWVNRKQADKKTISDELTSEELNDEEAMMEEVQNDNSYNSHDNELLASSQVNISKMKKKNNKMKDSSTAKTEVDLKKMKNDKILELYDSGKNIMDISKNLGIGQGEVKLVVDLYRGRRK